MTLDEAKNKIARDKGYPNWKELYDFTARDGALPAVVAQMIEANMKEAFDLMISERSTGGRGRKK